MERRFTGVIASLPSATQWRKAHLLPSGPGRLNTAALLRIWRYLAEFVDRGYSVEIKYQAGSAAPREIRQMSREEVYRFFEIVEALKCGEGQLSDLHNYSVRELSDAVQSLIDSAVSHEREECARLAEDSGEPGGPLTRGQVFEVEPARRQICLEVAGRIRAR